VTGSSLRDTLQADNTLNTWSLTDAFAGNVDGFAFTSFENLIGGRLDDTFALANSARMTSIDGGEGTDALDYSAFATAVSINLETASATGIDWFANIKRVVGSNQADTLTGRNTTNVWTLTGVDQGDLNGLFTFLAVERLTGGTARDVFVFGNTGSVSGVINGGPSGDWLDYQSVPGSVSVDLTRGTASKTGGVAAVEHVLGSRAGGSRLVGNTVANILVAFGTGNEVRGGLGRDLLIGGLGRNTVAGGAGDDVVIGGATNHDSDRDALEAFLREWSRAISYQSRVYNLLHGGGLTGNRRLVVTTPATASLARKAPAPSQIYGNNGQDFFAVRYVGMAMDLDRKRERWV
jgi:Ca2+-binding RTX toxin-like protein